MRLEFLAPPSPRALRKAFEPEWAMVPRFFDELGPGHADAKVLDRDGLRLVVGGDVDLEPGRRRRCPSRSAGVAELLEGVGGVGDQLADEDFLLRVERVDDDIEELLDLGLELELLRCGGGHGRNPGPAV
jgi:hypothetical protein